MIYSIRNKSQLLFPTEQMIAAEGIEWTHCWTLSK